MGTLETVAVATGLYAAEGMMIADRCANTSLLSQPLHDCGFGAECALSAGTLIVRSRTRRGGLGFLALLLLMTAMVKGAD
ncbi:MAG: hypothetical protein ACREQX_15010 [Candidatus Binataceae bacterium]